MMQADDLEKVSRSFREYSQTQGTLALILGALLAVVLASIILYSIISSRDRMVGRRMFLRLARASRLADAELKLFMHVARRALPDNPSALFVRRSVFEGAAADLPVDAGLIDAIRKKVYGP